MLSDLKFRIIAQGATAQAFTGVRSEVTKTQAAFAGLRTTLVGFGGGGLGALLGIGVGTALFRDARQAIGAVGDLADAAHNAGVSAEGLQVFRFGLEQTGGAAADADPALLRFNKNIGDIANTGAGPAAAAMQALGVSIRDAGGQIKPTEDILRDVMDGLAGVEDQARVSALAGDLFGDKLGPKLVGFLSQGGGAIDQYGTKLRDLGGLMTNEAVDAGDRLDDKFAEWALNLNTKYKTIVVAVAETLYDLADAFKAVENRTSLRMLRTDLEMVTSELQKEGEIISQLNETGTYDGLLFTTKTTEELIAEHQARLDGLIQQANQFNDRLLELQKPVDRPVSSDTELDFTDPADDTTDAIKTTTTAVHELYDSLAVTRNLTEDWLNTFADGLMNGKSLMDSLADAAKGLASQLLRMGITTLVGGVFPTPGPPGGAIMGGVNPINLIPRAAGGPVSAGMSYLVGERGPELFMPGRSGHITPGGGGITIHYAPQIDARGADRGGLDMLSERLRRQVQQELPAMIRKAQANRELR